MKTQDVTRLLAEVRACTICARHLPHSPNPVIQLDRQSRILIAGQAPGTRVQKTGVPFDDPSGDRLRDWLGVSKEQFYDASLFALIPMGLCYPGKGSSGDRPPRPECAITWRKQLLAALDEVQLTLVLGRYAQDYHLDGSNQSVTDRVRSWQTTWPAKLALPHPSPRNNIWLRRNPWFEDEVIPKLQQRVAEILK